VILTGDDALATALELAEAIRTDVECLRFDAHDLAATVSLGVAEAGEERDRGSIVRRADAALYQAKHEGRNRARQSGPSPARIV
jgi:diguanylate cyclase (GGDEF)-like protein